MAPHSSTLAWKTPWAEEPGRLQSMGSLRVGHNWATSLSCIGEGHGNPLQCSCLENPRDGGAWWAAVYGITQSRTRLKRLRKKKKTLAMTMPHLHIFSLTILPWVGYNFVFVSEMIIKNIFLNSSPWGYLINFCLTSSSFFLFFSFYTVVFLYSRFLNFWFQVFFHM